MFERFYRRMANEQGGIVSWLIYAILAAIVVISIIDSMALLGAYKRSGSVAEEAAQAAMEDFKHTGNQTRAPEVAAQYCEDRGYRFIDFQVQDQIVRTYVVTCGTDASTYMFYRLPYLKDAIPQQNSGSAAA